MRSPVVSTIEPLITIASAARQSGLAEWTLRRLVRTGAIPSVKVAGRVRRVRLSEVLAAIEASAVST
jgi:excisionase family DNA binding protein